MVLTTPQLQTLKAAILADPVLAALPPGTDATFQSIADAFNALASPDYWVLKTSVAEREYLYDVSVDGTTLTIGGSSGGMTARSVPELHTWDAMFRSGNGFVNPTLANVRAAFDDVFSGAGAGAQNNRAHCKAISRRKATRCEKVFAVDTPGSAGTRGTAADPDTLVIEGALSLQNVSDAMRS